VVVTTVPLLLDVLTTGWAEVGEDATPEFGGTELLFPEDAALGAL
jgi:hypothetical protein